MPPAPTSRFGVASIVDGGSFLVISCSLFHGSGSLMGAWGHLGITMGTGRGPTVDFRWIFGSQVGPDRTPNPFNLAHFVIWWVSSAKGNVEILFGGIWVQL